jgi:type IX secretion system substrate protein
MRKIFILTIIIFSGVSSYAQKPGKSNPVPVSIFDNQNAVFTGISSARKTTAIGDTVKMANIADSASLRLYTFDSGKGYVSGTNYFGDQSFAERFDFDGAVNSMQVIGVYALFGGKVNPASVKTVTLCIWDQGIPQVITDTLVYSGFPNNIMNGVTVPVTQIGIGTVSDTTKAYLFAYPSAGTTHSFFAGYYINYDYAALNGDTIAIASSLNGDRTSPKYSIAFDTTGGDTIITTIINVQNATQASDHTWYDNYTQHDSLFNDLAIYPIVVIGGLEGVNGITRKNLTFFGNYPNPAANNTNIKFSLSASADVTIQFMDMNGRVFNTVKQNDLSTGEHIVPINTAGMPSGDYLYLIHTSAGDGVGGKMTVVH